jgi:glycine cleavage system aminomethyltransferase T
VENRTRLPGSTHLALAPPPGLAGGHVTSSCWSPALRQPIALGRLKRGTKCLGEKLAAWHLDAAIQAEVAKTPFLEPAG